MAEVKAFGYVRCSTVGQLDKDGPVRQRIAIEQFCKTHGFFLAGVYEEGISGAELDRPQFHEMVLAAKEIGVSAIVVERQDRLARDLVVQETLLLRLARAGLKVYFTDQGLVDMAQEGDPTRKLIRQVLGAVAEFDRQSLKARMLAGRRREALRRGYWLRSKFGLTEREKLTLTRIYELWLSGHTYAGIARILNEEAWHAPPASGKPWCYSAVRRCVVNPAWWGLVPLGKEVREVQSVQHLYGAVYNAPLIATEWVCSTGEVRTHKLPDTLREPHPQPWEIWDKLPRDVQVFPSRWREFAKEADEVLYESQEEKVS